MNHVLIYAGIGLLGLMLQIGIKMNTQKGRAEALNVEFSVRKYFEADWLSVVISLIALALWLTFIPDIEAHYPAIATWWRLFFGFVGYGGTSLSTWAFSQMDARIKAAGKYKAKIADEATGNLDAPTPAAPIKKDK